MILLFLYFPLISHGLSFLLPFLLSSDEVFTLTVPCLALRGFFYAFLILRTLGLRKGGIEVVSCPTCGRTQIDLIGLANSVEEMVSDFDLDIKVAVMGCVVNGPGEAKEADIGIAGGKGEGLIIKKGQIIRKVKEEELLDNLRYELEHWRD